ncbi:MAG: putative cell cycle protein [Pseudobdellovibrio sp.]|jgi:tRNA(Ile)-lysidine synthase|nr:putative cell cycle protein [Pseudobdellovibrio sp.]
MSNWGRLEHNVWNHLADCGLQQNDSFALCVSGGLDSMALLQMFVRLKPSADIKVLHYHHGRSQDPEINSFRDKSLDCVKSAVESLRKSNVNFLSAKSDADLHSEEQFRDARMEFFKKSVNSGDVLVTAHHLDDRFETVLLKMIRGSSMDGVRSFQMWNGQFFRPFLQTAKAELLEYSRNSDLKWVEDPTNDRSDYLRNWVRREWLEDLEKKVPGGKSNLARSLFKMIDSEDDRTFEESFMAQTNANVLNRQWFSLLSPHNQNRSLALFLKKHQVYEFTAGQLEEIRKRLDKNQKELTFEMLGRKWVINATQIVIE